MTTRPGELKRLTIGINMMCASMLLTVIFFIAFVLFVLALPIFASLFGEENLAAYGDLSWIVYVVPPISYAIFLLGLIGHPLCLSAPREVGGTFLVLLTTFFACCGLIWSVIGYLIPLPNWPASLWPILSNFAFLLFALKLASFLDTPDLTRRVKSNRRGIIIGLLYWGLLLENGAVVGLLMLSGFQLVGGHPLPQFTMVMALGGALLIGLCLLIIPVIRYVSLLFAVRKELSRRNTLTSTAV